MSSTKHTPPSLEELAMIAKYVPEDADGDNPPAYFNIGDHICAGVVYGITQDEADARRDNIVSCVNAMQGIDDPAAFAKAARAMADLPFQGAVGCSIYNAQEIDKRLTALRESLTKRGA